LWKTGLTAMRGADRRCKIKSCRCENSGYSVEGLDWCEIHRDSKKTDCVKYRKLFYRKISNVDFPYENTFCLLRFPRTPAEAPNAVQFSAGARPGRPQRFQYHNYRSDFIIAVTAAEISESFFFSESIFLTEWRTVV